MKFHYYYLIQDFIGIMLAFVGIRMFLLCLKFIKGDKLTKNGLLLLIKYALFTLSGANLFMNSFGFKPWILSIVLMIISFAVTPKVRTTSN